MPYVPCADRNRWSRCVRNQGLRAFMWGKDGVKVLQDGASEVRHCDDNLEISRNERLFEASPLSQKNCYNKCNLCIFQQILV